MVDQIKDEQDAASMRGFIREDIEKLSKEQLGKLYYFMGTTLQKQHSELNEVLSAALDLYEPPFRYDLDGQMIFDSENNLIADVRGWGRIEKMENAVALQDAIGELIKESLNDTWDVLNKKRGR